MYFLRLSGAAVLGALALAACSENGADPGDAGPDVVYGHHSLDAALYEAEAAPKTPLDRLKPHAGTVLGAAQIRSIYIGTPNVDEAPSFDAYLSWLITSPDYWGAFLFQYGVGYGTFNGATEIPTDAFFLPGMVKGGIVQWYALDERIKQVIHAIDGDAGADASTLPPIPRADAYVFFLPDGVNVDLGQGQSTCANAAGYHSYDGIEPYSIIPPCGRYRLVVSHEMAEMATDPLPGEGWYSDTDIANGGGEIGDLCNMLMSVDGQQVTMLWSNKDGDCEPSPP
jgi:hypothetical protein